MGLYLARSGVGGAAGEGLAGGPVAYLLADFGFGGLDRKGLPLLSVVEVSFLGEISSPALAAMALAESFAGPLPPEN